MQKYINLFIIINLVFIGSVFSQTKIRGTIIDASTNKEVPFATVVFQNSTVGTITDFEGKFFLETKIKNDTLLISSIGYKPTKLAIKVWKYQEITVKLEPNEYKFDVIDVHAGENPANILLRKVLKHKKKNNHAKFNSYSYESYSKLELDINNFPTNLKDEKSLKMFDVVFAGIDTSAETGKVYMPILISETVSDYFYRKRPFPVRQKEIIKAVNVSGVENESVGRYTGQMYAEINFYDNYIGFFEKQFVSPIAINGLLVYEYYLTDSTFIDNNWCYQLTFKPRRKHEFTFKGNMWIADTTFALKEIEVQMSKHTNIDFIKSIYMKHEYTEVNDSLWFPDKEIMFVDFNLTNFTFGFFGKKTNTRRKIKINPTYPNKFFSKTVSHEIINPEGSINRDKASWDTLRHEQLTSKEQDVFNMVDSLNKVPAFRRLENLTMMFMLGYIKWGYFEFGPYYEIYSKNAVEGHRLSFGGRTSNKFSTKVELSGKVAYGFLDKKWKYRGEAKFKLSKKPWVLGRVSYLNDVTQLGANPNAFGSDNFFSSAVTRSPNNKLLMNKRFNAGIEYDLFSFITNSMFFSHKILYPSEAIPFQRNKMAFANLTTSEINFNTHIGINEEYISANFSRMSFGSIYPILDINFAYGIPNFLGSDYEYMKLSLSMRHHFYLGPLGKFKYFIESGKIWGKVPFPILKLHEGNETYVFEPLSFSLMNYYEFASDEYVAVFLENHFDGIIFNRIPFVRKLHLRELVFARGTMGRLSDDNKVEFEFPSTLSAPTTPYIEAGVGIENILTFFRVAAVWRLTNLDNPNISKFGLQFGAQVAF